MAKYEVTASALLVRTGPGVNYKSAGQMVKGTVVEPVSISNGWAKITENRYCSAQYLKEIVSADKATRLAPSYKPTKDLQNRPIYLMQTDSRWKNIPYTISGDPKQNIGYSGCGPTCASMIINEWIDGNYSPVEACAWAKANGYRTASNGTAWGMFKAVAVKYGLKFKQTVYNAEAVKWLKDNPGSLVVCIMSKGVWTTGGHFILMYDTDGTNVYINDPYSTAATKQKNKLSTLKAQCQQYFCFAKPEKAEDAETWASKNNIKLIAECQKVVAASVLNVRKDPTTSNGNNIIGTFIEGAIVRASKQCGDWFFCTGVTKDSNIISGWCAASYLEPLTLDNANGGIANVTSKALEYLADIGFIDTPSYWRANIFGMNYLTNLIIAIANATDMKKITKNPGKKDITSVTDAITILEKVGVIADSEYWNKNYTAVKNVDALLKKAATWLQ